MFFTLSKSHLINNIFSLTSRYYGSISKSSVKILRTCITSKDPTTLQTELINISKTLKIKNGTALTSIVAQFFITENLRVKDYKLAVDILKCLEISQPNSIKLGIMEIIDKCVEYEDMVSE